MGLDGLCYIIHSAVTYFHSVPVKYLVEGVVWREFFFDYFQEFFSDIRGYVFTVWRGVPDYVSVAILLICWKFGCWRRELELVFVSAFVDCFLV